MNNAKSVERLMGSQKLSEATKKGYLMRVRQYLKNIDQEPDEFISYVKAPPNKFEGCMIITRRSGAPVIEAAVTAFECSLKFSQKIGDYLLFASGVEGALHFRGILRVLGFHQVRA